MDINNTFGTYLKKKRLELESPVSLREMAGLLNISPIHMSNIEAGRDPPPNDAVLSNISLLLKLNELEMEQMYKLAMEANSIKLATRAFSDHLTLEDYTKIALRLTKDTDTTDREWMDFIRKLKDRTKTG